MRIEFIAQAGVKIHTAHGSILCDPWSRADRLSGGFRRNGDTFAMRHAGYRKRRMWTL